MSLRHQPLAPGVLRAVLQYRTLDADGNGRLGLEDIQSLCDSEAARAKELEAAVHQHHHGRDTIAAAGIAGVGKTRKGIDMVARGSIDAVGQVVRSATGAFSVSRANTGRISERATSAAAFTLPRDPECATSAEKFPKPSTSNKVAPQDQETVPHGSGREPQDGDADGPRHSRVSPTVPG